MLSFSKATPRSPGLWPVAFLLISIRSIAQNRPEAVILDMEYSRLTDVSNLHHDFPSVPIVCTYRIPDEELWIAAMDAGASDVCPADDVQNVLTSVLRSVAVAKSAAA